MTDKLAEIQARLEAATPGEWVWSSSYGDGGGQFLRLENDVNEVVIDAEGGGFLSLSDGDFNLIQYAPTDIRRLLNEIDRLRKIESEFIALVDLP